MGYFRPSSCYNKGKLQEFKDRKYFSEKKSVERLADAGKTIEAAE